MKVFKKLGFTLLLFLLYKNGAAQSSVTLKGSGYSMTLPKTYKIQKKQGVDYNTYYLIEKARPDSSKNFVMFGCCVGTIGGEQTNAIKIDSVTASILGQTAMWKIYTWDSSYLAETLVSLSGGDKAVFGIKTKHREEINLLIASFETLRKSK